MIVSLLTQVKANCIFYDDFEYGDLDIWLTGCRQEGSNYTDVGEKIKGVRYEWRLLKPCLAQFNAQELHSWAKTNIGCSEAVERLLNEPPFVSGTFSCYIFWTKTGRN